MRFPSFLYSAFLTPIIPLEKEAEPTCPSSEHMLKIILYEAYIPIDAFTFKIGINRMNKGEISDVIDHVLLMKKNILQDPNNAAKVFNLSDIINEESTVKLLLTKRRTFIKDDPSFIFKELINQQLAKIMKCIHVIKGKITNDPRLDAQYRKMIQRIHEAIYENLDIQETINREKEEFYRDIRKDITPKDYRRAKISLSLGGSIFYLPYLVKLVNGINHTDKTKFVREWVNNMFNHIEKLSIAIASKHFIEQKYLVKEFIRNSTETGPSNNAFEARTAMIKAANMTMDEIDELSGLQSAENAKLLRTIENMDEQQWLIRYNKEIREDMLVYLMTLQPVDKKRLLAHFK